MVGEVVPFPVARRSGQELSDEELVQEALGEGEASSEALESLFSRYERKVAAWCLRICSSRDEAADVTQEVFIRVQQRLGSFRGDSSFATWLYTVTRRVAINHGIAARRKHAESLDEEGRREEATEDPAPDVLAEREELARALREAMARDLEPLEARVLYLHYVDGLTLPAITGLLGLTNRSGAKAYIVAGRRKLERRFGRWLRREGFLPR